MKDRIDKLFKCLGKLIDKFVYVATFIVTMITMIIALFMNNPIQREEAIYHLIFIVILLQITTLCKKEKQ